MNPYRTAQVPSSSSCLTEQDDSADPNPPNLMKAPKRKRLAKACDACHKSKRRCDGTAPCSNCYYASKACSYTDASGRPVPAPRPFKPERSELDLRPPQSSPPTLQLPPQNHTDDDNHHSHNPQPQNSFPRKRFRNERGNPIPTDNISSSLPLPSMDGPVSVSLDRPAPVDLDHALTRELTNLFFTHCHPARAIIHKPTFSTSLAHNRVPAYLLHAVCALAAPLSKQPRLRTTPSRFAGKPFAQEALSIMFDGAGRLVCEPNLATAQALCLIQLHDVATKDKNMYWDSRYQDLALQIIESLNVYQPDYPTLTPVPTPEFIQASIEREALRRIFWLIHLMDIIAHIFFKKQMMSLREPGLRLRLPADETTFELGVSTLPEYLHLPAVRTQYSSEFGHLIRVLTIYDKVEAALDELNDPNTTVNPRAALAEAEQLMESWAGSLSEHLRFSESSLEVQRSMFETSSNTGAWCWCLMHVFHATSALALNVARQHLQGGPKTELQWALNILDSIAHMLGDRVKNSFIMGAILWGLIKYCKRDDSQIRAWYVDYEDTWGTRMRDLALNWRLNTSPASQHPLTSQQHRLVGENRSSPTIGVRPSSQHDSSYSHRPPDNSLASLYLGKQHEEARLHNSNTHIMPLQPDRDDNSRGHENENMNERDQGLNTRWPVHDSDLDPILQNGVSAVSLGEHGGRGSGDQSLPSLKSSGLLDSWNPGGGVQHPMGQGGNPTQQQSPPCMSSPHLVSMPVGLPWLANESR